MDRDKVGEVNRGQITEGLLQCTKEIGIYSKDFIRRCNAGE